MKPIIRVEGLGKQYRIGRRDAAPYSTLRESLTETARAPLRLIKTRLNGAAKNSDSEGFWALRDVSFDVMPGEVVGIIGRNGAGKSTLLKILSRVTEPTTGGVDLYGRVGSLLEVGTGFHPELTGRENIYLNGAILGMKQREIDQKFDSIVEFAEVDQFLDTPVKRYSSGMFVRLAFSVASHLDPEVLVIDEVLAVGDSGFQKKCMDRVAQIAAAGRTVLLVTHNMAVAVQMCTRAILLGSGCVVDEGPPDVVVATYQSGSLKEQDELVDMERIPRRHPSRLEARLVGCRLATLNKEEPWALPYGTSLEIEVLVSLAKPFDDLELGLALSVAGGFEVVSSLSTDAMKFETLPPGLHLFHVTWPSLRLTPGGYCLGLGLRSGWGMEDYLPMAAHFDVTPNSDSTAVLAHLRRGAVIPDLECLVRPSRA